MFGVLCSILNQKLLHNLFNQNSWLQIPILEELHIEIFFVILPKRGILRRCSKKILPEPTDDQ